MIVKSMVCVLLMMGLTSLVQAKTKPMPSVPAQVKPSKAPSVQKQAVLSKKNVANLALTKPVAQKKPVPAPIKPKAKAVVPPVQAKPTVKAPEPIVPQTPIEPKAIEPIYLINQRFANVPLEYCPTLSKGYGFEVSYPSSDSAANPVIVKVYGNAYLSGLKEGAELVSIDGKTVRSQADFNTIAYKGLARQAGNLIPSMSLGVLNKGVAQEIQLTKGDYLLRPTLIWFGFCINKLSLSR